MPSKKAPKTHKTNTAPPSSIRKTPGTAHRLGFPPSVTKTNFSNFIDVLKNLDTGRQAFLSDEEYAIALLNYFKNRLTCSIYFRSVTVSSEYYKYYVDSVPHYPWTQTHWSVCRLRFPLIMPALIQTALVVGASTPVDNCPVRQVRASLPVDYCTALQVRVVVL